ncbi:MAG: hypothetical protein EZS28_034257 [Streblomastix strix]|uniref:Uncharacterized protein n=1 Tax=Streblomastix strix TaxID=222440 RepID=A0A5J4UHD7_9EUKA|nr:MAG: hypothetical protein EZS28_034257 [Streblomastix strix]
MNDGAGGSQFPMGQTRHNEDSCKQSSSNEIEWFQGFRVNDMAPKLLEKIKKIKELQKELLEGYYGTKLENLDMMGERASLEVRSDIKRREMTNRQWVRDERDVAILAGALDLLDEHETQRFAINGIKMTKTAMADMIIGNKEMVMNESLSTNHALRIIAGDAQMQREVVIAPNDAKEVLKTDGGATLLYGCESKKKVEEVLKHSKLIANQESTGSTTAGKSEAIQQTQRQMQAIQPVQKQQKFTGFRSNVNGKGCNKRFFQQPATFANCCMNQPSLWGNAQLGISRPYNQSWTGLGQQSQSNSWLQFIYQGHYQQQKRQAPKFNMPKYPKPRLDSNHAQTQPQHPRDARSGSRKRVDHEQMSEGSGAATDGQSGGHECEQEGFAGLGGCRFYCQQCP